MFLEHFIKTVTGVNFRKAPVDGPVIKMLKTGTVLEVIGIDKVSGWYNARLSDGTIGYITYKPAYVVDCKPAWLKKVQDIVLFGEGYLGTPYKFGSDRTSDVTFDCSDFVKWIYKKYGYTLSGDSRAQFSNGVASDQNDLRSGDLVFFCKDDGYIYHVGMYVKVDYKDRILHTYNTTCDIYDRNLKKVKDDCGGVTFSDFSTGSSWRKKAMLETRRIITGDKFSL